MTDDEKIVVTVPCSAELAKMLADNEVLRREFERRLGEEVSRRLLADMAREYGLVDPSGD
jgi:hypothetical protein